MKFTGVPSIESYSGTNSAVHELIQAARQKLSIRLPNANFDEPFWDVSSLKVRLTKQGTRRLYFTVYETMHQPLPNPYGDVIKSWIVLDGKSVSNMLFRLDAARILWEAIRVRRGNEPETFEWLDLSEEDLSQAEQLMCQKWALSTTYKVASYLVALANFLAARKICRPLYYTLQTPRTESLDRHTIAGQEVRRAKLPSKQVLEGLADIYHTHAKTPPDRLRAAALAILVVTGFRIGELLTLPKDCEIEEIRRGKAAYGLRYYKEKARSSEKMYDVRWLTTIGAELARSAIAEIRSITEEARSRARLLEQNPNKVPIPGFRWTDRMTPDDVAKVLGMQNRHTLTGYYADTLPRHKVEEDSYYNAYEVEKYLLSQRAEHLWTIDRGNGNYQLLSETLLIAFRNFFHPLRGTNPLLVEPITIQHLSDFLAGRKGTKSKSAFERFSIREADGSFCKMTSHQFRHWLNDLADKGGLPVDLQTRWMGRENSRDTEAYRHASVDERLRWVKEGIREGTICGPIADMYFELPQAERDIFLEGQIQAAHFTSFGVCVHDFGIDPCPYHLNCVRGCSEYLRVKGNQKEIIYLTQVQKNTEKALEAARTQITSNDVEIAQAWIQHHEETLAGVKAALAIEKDISIEDDTVVRPFEGRPSQFEPLRD